MTPAKAEAIPKKRSSKQKEREKKRLSKLLERKAKQGKMLDILASLQKHKNDIGEEDYAKMLAAKNLGKGVPGVRRDS